MSIGIYKIENLINNKIYIGQSIHIEKRWSEHCQNSSKSLIGQAIKKYGKENFSFQILEEVLDISELNNLETKYIKQFNSLIPNGYNIKLIDNQEHHQFNTYNFEIFQFIIDDIKNSILTFQEIANKYDLDLSTIYYLNRGDYHTLPNETYPLRKVKDVSKKDYFCIDCGCLIKTNANRCVSCAQIAQRKVIRPNREELKQLIRTLPFTKIGEKFGVSDRAIRKWCKVENLPSKVSEIKKYSDADWKII